MIFETAASEDDWTVNFEGGFWGDFGWGSQKVPVHQSFQYCDETCVVPYLYLCPEGVVIDYCVGIEPEMLDAFLKKWNFPERTECDELRMGKVHWNFILYSYGSYDCYRIL